MFTNIILVLLLVAAVAVTVITKKLTVAGGVAGGIFAMLLYFGTGWTGLLLMAAFFIVGTAATSWNSNLKKKLPGEGSDDRRDVWQVWANGGVAALCALLALANPQWEAIMLLLVAAAFSSAAADTVSSELGNLYGSRYYNILSFKSDQRGRDGVVSLEGTLCGLAGSVLITAVYIAGNGETRHWWILLVAGTVGNISDSVLGATVERCGLLGNNAVNFLNTLIAAITALILVFVTDA